MAIVCTHLCCVRQSLPVQSYRAATQDPRGSKVIHTHTVLCCAASVDISMRKLLCMLHAREHDVPETHVCNRHAFTSNSRVRLMPARDHFSNHIR